MYPERRFYKASEQTSTIVANHSTLREDLYLVYSGQNPDTAGRSSGLTSTRWCTGYGRERTFC